MPTGADLLATLLGDALGGKPVKLGFTDTPKIIAAITSLRDDPEGRGRVFDAALRAALTSDPTLRMRCMRVLTDFATGKAGASHG